MAYIFTHREAEKRTRPAEPSVGVYVAKETHRSKEHLCLTRLTVGVLFLTTLRRSAFSRSRGTALCFGSSTTSLSSSWVHILNTAANISVTVVTVAPRAITQPSTNNGDRGRS